MYFSLSSITRHCARAAQMYIVKKQRRGVDAIYHVEDDDKIYYICLFARQQETMIAYIDASIVSQPVEGWEMKSFIGPIYGAKNAHVIAIELSTGRRGWDTSNLKALDLFEKDPT